MLRATADRIIVKLHESVEKGLILTPESNKYSHCGEVVSVGPLVKTVPIGAQIIFHPFDELPLPEDGLVVVREASILAFADEN